MELEDLRTLTVEDAAAVLAVDPETVRRWIRAGTLSAMHWGRRYRITRDAIAAFQKSHQVKTRDPGADVRARLRAMRKGGRT